MLFSILFSTLNYCGFIKIIVRNCIRLLIDDIIWFYYNHDVTNTCEKIRLLKDNNCHAYYDIINYSQFCANIPKKCFSVLKKQTKKKTTY